MIVIAGYMLTEADKRDAAAEAFAGMVKRARKYDGCLDQSMSADSVDPDRINLFECWRDQLRWKAWRKVAKPPRVKLGETFVKLYRSDKPRSHSDAEHAPRFSDPDWTFAYSIAPITESIGTYTSRRSNST